MRLQLRQRLVRLEKVTARQPADDHDELRWRSELMDAYLDAYARQEEAARRRQDGSGDDCDTSEPFEAALGRAAAVAPWPRCPSGIDPAQWESRRRMCAYLATEEPPPGLTGDEKAYVDELWAGQVVAALGPGG
jgi:hypothetical protein